MDWQDACEIVAVLVATGRAVPVDQWVDELVAERKLATLEGLI